MIILLKINTYGYEDGGSVDSAYGPFADQAEADAFKDRVEGVDLVGVEYQTITIKSPDALVDWINQLGMGTV